MRREGAPVVRFLVFAVICVLATVWLATVLGNIAFFSNRTSYTARFDDDVVGLLDNDQVKIAGVTVGKVTALEVDDGGGALVTFTVDNAVLLPEDSTVQIRWRDVLGLRFLYVHPGTSEVLATGSDDDVDFPADQTMAPPSVGQFLTRITPFIKALDPKLQNEVLRALQQSVVGREAEIREIVSDGADLTEALASRDDALGRLLDNASTILDEYAQRDEDIRALVDSLVNITETLARRNAALDDGVTALADLQAEFGTLLEANEDDLRAALDALETTTTTLSDNSETLDTLLALSPNLIAYHRVSRLGQWFNVRGVGLSGDYTEISSERGASLPPRDEDGGGGTASVFQAPLGRTGGS